VTRNPCPGILPKWPPSKETCFKKPLVIVSLFLSIHYQHDSYYQYDGTFKLVLPSFTFKIDQDNLQWCTTRCFLCAAGDHGEKKEQHTLSLFVSAVICHCHCFDWQLVRM